MSGRNARFDARTSVTRVFGIVAVLAGILLLQGSLCDGSLTSSVPCVASCDEAFTSVVDHPVEVAVDAAVDVAAPDLPGDHDGLVSLCVTVLLAVLGLFAVLRRPDGSRAVPRPSSAPPMVRNHVFALPRLCVLRI